eukprot:sb/3474828/
MVGNSRFNPQNDPNFYYDQVYGWVRGSAGKHSQPVYKSPDEKPNTDQILQSVSSNNLGNHGRPNHDISRDERVLPRQNHPQHHTVHKVKVEASFSDHGGEERDKSTEDLTVICTAGGVALFCSIVFIIFCSIQ